MKVLLEKTCGAKVIFFFLGKNTSLGNKDFRGVLSLIKKAFFSDERGSFQQMCYEFGEKTSYLS